VLLLDGRIGQSRRVRGAVGAMVFAVLAIVFPVTVAAARPSGLQPVAGEVLPGLSAFRDLGPAPASQQLEVVVTPAVDIAALQAAYRAIYTPGSATFHRFLTPGQIAARFGDSRASWRVLERWLTDGGLRIAYASGTRDLLEVTGSVATVERQFGVQLRSFRSAHESFLANVSAPLVPARLRITHVLGLNTFERLIPDRVSRALLATGASNMGVQTPQEIWGAYGAPAASEGAGQSVAMFGEGASASVVSDLGDFERSYGLPAVPATVQTVGPGPFTDTSNSEEWDLDTQAEAGMAPRATGIKMYFAKDLTDASVSAMFSAWEADSHAPLQADASFGSCEANPIGLTLDSLLGSLATQINNLTFGTSLLDDLAATADPILLEATLQGKTLFAGAGDTGSSCPVIELPVVGGGNGLLNQVVPFTNYPASSPYVVAAGGTVLYTNGSGASATRGQEYAWTFGGGGDTLFVAKPGYQGGVASIDLPCISTAFGSLSALGSPCRGVPDVSAMSGDGITNAYPIVSGGKATDAAGTSLSGPLLAGLWTRIQGANSFGGNGFANETFYAVGKNAAMYARDFFDVKTGLLGLPLIGNGLYLSGAGWDYATGWGVPNVGGLIHDVDGR
jgi:pseudomonalisin